MHECTARSCSALLHRVCCRHAESSNHHGEKLGSMRCSECKCCFLIAKNSMMLHAHWSGSHKFEIHFRKVPILEYEPLGCYKAGTLVFHDHDFHDCHERFLRHGFCTPGGHNRRREHFDSKLGRRLGGAICNQ